MTTIEEALSLKHELDNLRPLSKEQEDTIMQKFRLDWNYNSNNLEGNSLTYGETKALLLHGITAQGKPLKDHVEITGHDEAVRWIEDVVKGDYPLTESFIRQLHTLLLKDPYEVRAITPDGKATARKIAVGQYKTAPNHVLTSTGDIFRFATPEETPSKMHDLVEWYRSESEHADVNPIILAAEFHYRFIRIHPFDDGNGRTARILMNFILMKAGYPPVVIKTEDKQNYFTALREADAGIIAPFIDYIAINLVRSLQIMLAGARGETIEEDDDVLKELALLKAKLKREKIRKSTTTAFNTVQSFTKHLLPYFEETIEQVADFFTEKDSSQSMNGKVCIEISEADLNKDETDNIQWSVVYSGLNGGKNGTTLEIVITLELTPLYPALKIAVSDQKVIQHIFDYESSIDTAIVAKLRKQLLKSITNAIKMMV